jgi:ABC-type transporter MlaC component
MKKILFLSLIFTAVIATTTHAQNSGPAATPQPTQAEMLQKMKDQQKPGLIEKVGLTDAQADKFIEINFDIRMRAATELKGLSDEQRTAKLAELKAEKEKRYSQIPLTAEQIKAVQAYYEEMGKKRN